MLEPRLRLDFSALALHASGGSGAAPGRASMPAPIVLRGPVQSLALAPGDRGAESTAGDAPGSGDASAGGAGRPGNESQQPEAPVPFDPTPAGPVARPTAARPDRPSVAREKAGQADLPDLSGETWALAPIRWGGNTMTGGNYFQGADDEKVMSLYNTLNLQANSFVVAPYIAQWSGLLGMGSTSSTYTPQTGADIESQSKTMNLGGGINVFPQSRFPFSANVNYSTSGTESGNTSSPSSTTSVGAQQNYRTEDGRDNYALGFNRTNMTSGGSGVDYSSVMWSANGNYSTSREFEFGHLLEGNHSLSANVSTSSATADFYDQSFQGFSGTASHSWVVHEDLSINNMATFARNNLKTLQGNLLAQNNSTVFLGTTGFTWRPFDDMPLTFTGGGNFSMSQTDNFNQTYDFRNIGGYVGTSYQFSRNLSASAFVSLNSSSGNGTSTTTFNQNTNVSYSGDPISFMGFTYGWGTGGGVSAYTGSVGGGGFGLNMSANHNLGRAIALNSNNLINLNASQSLSLTSASSQGNSVSSGSSQNGGVTSFSNMAGATWQASYGEQVTTTLSANVSHNSTKEDTGDSQYVTASLMGTGNYQISSRAALTFNVNLNWSKTHRDAVGIQALNGLFVDSNAPQQSGSLSMGYSHQSPFSIPNLNYSANLVRTNLISSDQRLVGAVATPNTDNGSTSLQQSLNYRVGRLSFRLDQFIAEQAGRKSASIFGSVTREFDGFFNGRW
ncbi:MAG: hypothetical protein Q7T25_01320 [Sideroxyarcus sp.]|nr:hypothetical protein [Sideroxyarcus sp.]